MTALSWLEECCKGLDRFEGCLFGLPASFEAVSESNDNDLFEVIDSDDR